LDFAEEWGDGRGGEIRFGDPMNLGLQFNIMLKFYFYFNIKLFLNGVTQFKYLLLPKSFLGMGF